MKNWTPGPWWHSDLMETKDFEVWCGDGRTGDGPFVLCQLPNYRRALPKNSRLHDVPQRANAYLIAAAPELVEALERCVRALEQHAPSPEADSAVEQAKLALSKANGQV